MNRYTLLSAAFFLAAIPTTFAGHPIREAESKTTVVETEFPFVRGTHEAELNLGTYWTFDTDGDAALPDMGIVIGTVSYGWMLSDVRGDGFFRGNWEFLLSGFGGGIVEGPGDVILGIGLSLRYNFVQPNAVVVPFIDLGGGGAYSDAANDDAIQRVIGADFSFDLHASLGLRFMVNERFAITLTGGYRHFSNAGTNDRNHSFNGLGGTLGGSWFY